MPADEGFSCCDLYFFFSASFIFEKIHMCSIEGSLVHLHVQDTGHGEEEEEEDATIIKIRASAALKRNTDAFLL